MSVPSPAVLDVPVVDLTACVARRERYRVVRAASLEASR
jgi:hypothetical protein